MDCLYLIAPTDEALINYALDGEALPADVQRHLEDCEMCKRRLARFQQANAYLITHLYRQTCPTGEELSYYASNILLSDEARLRVANHILDCPLCEADLQETRSFLQTNDVVAPPSFSPRQALRRIFATRVQPHLLLAVRGDTVPDASWPRQYKAGHVDLSLHLSRASNGDYMLLGILTSTAPTEDLDALAGVSAELYHEVAIASPNGQTPADSPFLETILDDMGNMVFKPLPLGNYTLLIRLPGRELMIEGLCID